MLAVVKDQPFINLDQSYEGRYVCLYEPDWNAKPWHDAVEREVQP